MKGKVIIWLWLIWLYTSLILSSINLFFSLIIGFVRMVSMFIAQACLCKRNQLHKQWTFCQGYSQFDLLFFSCYNYIFTVHLSLIKRTGGFVNCAPHILIYLNNNISTKMMERNLLIFLLLMLYNHLEFIIKHINKLMGDYFNIIKSFKLKF